MKRLHFAITIDAPREAVWEAMLAPATYRLWTAEFAEGSYFEGSWGKGKRIRFPGARRRRHNLGHRRESPHEFISIKHLGYIKDWDRGYSTARPSAPGRRPSRITRSRTPARPPRSEVDWTRRQSSKTT